MRAEKSSFPDGTTEWEAEQFVRAVDISIVDLARWKFFSEVLKPAATSAFCTTAYNYTATQLHCPQPHNLTVSLTI